MGSAWRAHKSGKKEQSQESITRYVQIVCIFNINKHNHHLLLASALVYNKFLLFSSSLFACLNFGQSKNIIREFAFVVEHSITNCSCCCSCCCCCCCFLLRLLFVFCFGFGKKWNIFLVVDVDDDGEKRTKNARKPHTKTICEKENSLQMVCCLALKLFVFNLAVMLSSVHRYLFPSCICSFGLVP